MNPILPRKMKASLILSSLVCVLWSCFGDQSPLETGGAATGGITTGGIATGGIAQVITTGGNSPVIIPTGGIVRPGDEYCGTSTGRIYFSVEGSGGTSACLPGFRLTFHTPGCEPGKMPVCMHNCSLNTGGACLSHYCNCAGEVKSYGCARDDAPEPYLQWDSCPTGGNPSSSGGAL